MAPDPKTEVPGELPAIDETLTTMTKLGTAFENAGQGFQKISTDGWKGATADAFQDYYQQEPPKWFRAADAFTDSANALRQYRDTLAWAQRQAEQACADIEAAERQSERARAQYEKSDATEPFEDPSAAARQQAQAALDDAKDQVEEAAKKAAVVLLKAADEAPPEPGLLTRIGSNLGDIAQNVAESYGDFWRGSFEGGLEMLQQLRAITPFDPYNLTHPSKYAENMGNLVASTFAAGKAFVTDPIGTTKAMASAGIDSFTKDPFGTLGKLAPEVAAGLVTGGSSTASSVTRKIVGELKDGITPDTRKADDWNWTPDSPAAPPSPPPHTPPAPRPEPVPQNHQPPTNTSTPSGGWDHSPTPNHNASPPPPQQTTGSWTDTNTSHSTPQPPQGHLPESTPNSPSNSWGTPTPTENHHFGPKGSDWDGHNTKDESTSPHNEEPRRSPGRGTPAWETDPDYDPWSDSDYREDPEPDRHSTPDRAPEPDSDPREPNEPGPERRDDETDDRHRDSGHEDGPADHDRGDARSDSHHDRPGIDDLFPNNGVFDGERALAMFKETVDGEYGGLHVSVSEVVKANDDSITMRGTITDENNREVGNVVRYFDRLADGSLSVTHNRLEIDKEFQGAGLSKEFNQHMENWYRESGVKEIRLHANIDVGSYAWARQGFEFAKHEEAVAKILPRLNDEIIRTERNMANLEQQLATSRGAELEELNNRIRHLDQALQEARGIQSRFHVGSPDFPTPYEISEVGRPKDLQPGESRNLGWFGKNVLKDPTGKPVEWGGVKTL